MSALNSFLAKGRRRKKKGAAKPKPAAAAAAAPAAPAYVAGAATLLVPRAYVSPDTASLQSMWAVGAARAPY